MKSDTAYVVLRDLVNGTVGFESLAAATGKPAQLAPNVVA